MGLFDKLFGKKYCDVCGAEMALFGNEKIADGIVCKACHTQLSPFFRNYRTTNVEGIRKQLAYREANKALVAAFTPTKTVACDRYTFYFDEDKCQFICTYMGNWRDENPDVIHFSQVIDCRSDVEETREEIKRKDSEGNEVSYDPPHYEYEYDFYIDIHVDSPWFSQLHIKVNNGYIKLVAGLEYKQARDKCREIERVFDRARIREQEREQIAHAPQVPVQCPACGANAVPDANGCCQYCGTHLG